ncbi:cobalamin biosynthesis protein CobW [Halobacteriales archaeon QS_5_70_17]|nr:MAG: cobalamin biosynthesis protein CobW [Halobacteriales archaeon QS_5_70_17]
MSDALDETDGSARVPVTVLTGPLGAGKTTLVNHLLREAGDRSIAVLVNDMGEVNIDAALIESEADDGIVDLSNGCICCRLRGDLLSAIDRLARERSFDHLVVEASGISEPMPIARTLTLGDADSDVDPTDRYRLDTVVTVVDAYGFWKEFDAGERPPSGADPDRPLADVLVDGIEFCDVVVLNKCDMVPEDALGEIEAVVDRIQPRAPIHRTTHSAIDPDRVLDTGRFDFETARREQGWKRELAADGDAAGRGHGHDHEERSAAAAHGVGSVVYERDRPFAPEPFADWVEDWDGSIVRAKGFCWLASRPDEVVGLSQAGPSVRVGPIGEWGEDDPATRLVFIGRDLEEERLADELDACLTDGDGDGDDPFPRETLLR